MGQSSPGGGGGKNLLVCRNPAINKNMRFGKAGKEGAMGLVGSFYFLLFFVVWVSGLDDGSQRNKAISHRSSSRMAQGLQRQGRLKWA